VTGITWPESDRVENAETDKLNRREQAALTRKSRFPLTALERAFAENIVILLWSKAQVEQLLFPGVSPWQSI